MFMINVQREHTKLCAFTVANTHARFMHVLVQTQLYIIFITSCIFDIEENFNDIRRIIIKNECYYLLSIFFCF